MPSPLTHLPQELHLQIIKNLKQFPTTMLLRLTNKYFHTLIQPLTDSDMSRLEHRDYCRDHSLRCCLSCHRLRPSHNFVPYDLAIAIFPEHHICIDCGMHKGVYCHARGEIFKLNARTRVVCTDCSDLPKGNPRRLEDLCHECWKGLQEQSHGRVFPFWKEGLSEEEGLIQQGRMLAGAGRFFHRVHCRKCGRAFRGCEALVEAARREEVVEGM